MKVLVGADHRGFEAKNKLIEFLTKQGYEVVDLGAKEYNPEDDFNDFAIAVCKGILASESFGIIICGSGHGVCMQANRIKGIRAISCINDEMAKIGRWHNNANVLCLSADYSKQKELEEISSTFLSSIFLNRAQYNRRNARLDEEVYA